MQKEFYQHFGVDLPLGFYYFEIINKYGECTFKIYVCTEDKMDYLLPYLPVLQ